MKAIVWSKDACPFCVQAKALLESRGIEFEERNVNRDWTKDRDFAENAEWSSECAEEFTEKVLDMVADEEVYMKLDTH